MLVLETFIDKCYRRLARLTTTTMLLKAELRQMVRAVERARAEVVVLRRQLAVEVHKVHYV